LLRILFMVMSAVSRIILFKLPAQKKSFGASFFICNSLSRIEEKTFDESLLESRFSLSKNEI